MGHRDGRDCGDQRNGCGRGRAFGEKFTSHENFYIRSNAVATQLNISNDMTLKVLAQQQYPLSKMATGEILQDHKIPEQPRKGSGQPAFESENESVRVLELSWSGTWDWWTDFLYFRKCMDRLL